MTEAAASQIPPIVRQAERLLAEIEISVQRFARKDRYSVGQSLRTDAFELACLATRAWHDVAQRRQRARDLVVAVDYFKIRLQTAKRVNAFRSLDEFEALGRTVVELGRQSGGWLKSLQTMGQNAPARQAPAQRAPILSSRAAHAATP